MPKFLANIDMGKGQLVNARVENLSSLPAFIPGEDEGRLLYVTTGSDQGFWFGSQDGSSSFGRLLIGSQIGQYVASAVSINNGVTSNQTLSATNTPATKAYVAKVEITTAVSSGQFRIEMFEDVARSEKFYDAVFDLADPKSDRLPAYFELDNVTGDLYVDLTNLSGSNGTFTVNIKTAGVEAVTTPPPPGDGSGINAGVAGDGIEYNSSAARLDVDLLTNGGLQLTGSDGSKELSVKLQASGGLEENAGAGLRVDPTLVPLGGVDSNDITSRKAFSQFGLVPSGSTGAPTSGTHNAGEIHMDQNHDLYMCISTGTPGTWIFYGWKETRFGGNSDATNYVTAAGGIGLVAAASNVAAGGNVVLEVPTSGRRGWIRKMNVWAVDQALAASEIDIPFRIRAFPNENLAGREQLWSVAGQARKTYTSGSASSGQETVGVNDSNIANLDDLVRLHVKATPIEEFQRVIVRRVGPPELDMDENLVTSMVANDIVCFCTEYVNLPWRNNSGVGANSKKIYLQFVNDDAAQAVVFGVDLLFDEIGGGSPVT